MSDENIIKEIVRKVKSNKQVSIKVIAEPIWKLVKHGHTKQL